ncbi:N-acetylmuramoyl-L-alanine amidase [Poriferisphaera sp. WC338]|uniref:N-acetylmuramoyl-L-alanine amidase n=1 Tax=Poriferisphaera sp. WC338 TaxID=3425129 RepID=UPI003D8172E9
MISLNKKRTALNTFQSVAAITTAAVAITMIAGCNTAKKPGDMIKRSGQEIVVAGQLFNVGAPVVLWMDEGGYDAYRVDKRFGDYQYAKWEHNKDKLDTPNRYNLRYGKTTQEKWDPDQIEQLRGGGWDLKTLQDTVDQFVYHYDVCGTSERCFKVLHDMRGLSVHFMLDIDGTIYQTMDLKERAWHAGTSNDRSIGIEIANIGAYSDKELAKDGTLDKWYGSDKNGDTIITLPAYMGDGGIRTPNFVGKPFENDPTVGKVQGRKLTQYDLTPEQYDSLIKLTAALSKVFPKIKLDYPRGEDGKLNTKVLIGDELNNYQGLIGHYHISKRKIDPGPAFQWDYVIEEAKKLNK